MHDPHAWIGRTEESRDKLTPAMLSRLDALLDWAAPAARQAVSPLAHWLCFLPSAPQSSLDEDGHPRRGGFLPPIDLPRRMWAGGRLHFHAPIPLDVTLVRRSTIADVVEKQGKTGRLAFVTVRHYITAGDVLITTEEQDIVYREAFRPDASSRAASLPPPIEPYDAEHRINPDSRLLFRFSALTFNAHRIHYDRSYATEVEGFAGLVVHGPLVATMLLYHGLDGFGGPSDVRPTRFSFRALRPLVDGKPFSLCRATDTDCVRLWARDADGHVATMGEIA